MEKGKTMRLIDADALLDNIIDRICNDCDKRKGIKAGKWRIIYSIGDAPCRACSVDDTKDDIDSAQTIDAVPAWIPVTERLPEEEKKRYWVCTDTEYQCECRWTNNRFGMGEFDEWGWSIFDIPQYSHVVAWMPLPEPYKGERKD